jgi:membrane-bound serine protease (ClpP class)
MFLVIISFLLGVSLIYLEFFVPGIIISLLGSLSLIISLLLFGLKIPKLSFIIIAAIAELFILFFVIRVALWQLKKTSLVVKKE